MQDDHLGMMLLHPMQDDILNMDDRRDIINLILDTYLCKIFVSKKRSSISATSIGLYHLLLR